MIYNIDGLNIFYQSIGQGRPIIFLHGYWAEGEQMMGVMEPILSERAGWRRIYIDLPGMGQTPGPDWIQNSDHVLETISKFVDAVIPTGTFTIGGYSYGGYIAQGLVSRLAERIDGLFMVCPVIYGDYKKRTLPEGTPPITEDNDPVENTADLDFLTRLRHFGYSFSFDLWQHQATFDKPTLILTGRQDDAVGYHDAYTQLVHYPRATYAVLENAGHGLPYDQPGIFKVMVNEWLDRIASED